MKQKLYSGFWKRVLMSFIDVLIFVGMYYIYDSSSLANYVGINPTTFTLKILLIIYVITIFFWKLFGGTPGKLMLGSRIFDAATYKRPKLIKLLLRAICYLPSSLMLSLGFISSAWNSRKQTWHDRVAGTVVINKKYCSKEKRIETRRDKRSFKIITSIIILNSIVLISLSFPFFHKEKLNPAITELMNKTYDDPGNPEENAFYYLAGFNCSVDEDPYETGIKLMSDIEITDFASTNENELIIPYIVELEDIWESNDTEQYNILKHKIDSLKIVTKTLDGRWEHLIKTKYFFTPYEPTFRHKSIYILNNIMYFRLRLFQAYEMYIYGDREQAKLILTNDQKFIHIMLAESDVMISKIFFMACERLLLDTYRAILENNDVSIKDKNILLNTLAHLNSDALSIEKVVLRDLDKFYSDYFKEYNYYKYLHARVSMFVQTNICKARMFLNCYDAAEIDCSMAEDFPFDEMVKYLYFDLAKILNETYGNALELAQLVENGSPRVSEYDLPYEDYDFRMNNYIIMLIASQFHYKGYIGFCNLHNLNGYISLLKLKLEVMNKRIPADQMIDFLDSQKEILGDPFKDEPMKWDAETSEIYFEGIAEDKEHTRIKLNLK